MPRLLSIGISLALFAACSSPSGDDPDAAPTDAAPIDVAVDAPIDGPPAPVCVLDLDRSFVGAEPDTFAYAVHAHATGWFMTYTTGAQEVWLVAMAHDGTITAGPTRLGAGGESYFADDGTRTMILFGARQQWSLQPLTGAGAPDGAAIALTPPSPPMVAHGIVAGPAPYFRVVWSQPAPSMETDLAIVRFDRAGAAVGAPVRRTVDAVSVESMGGVSGDRILLGVQRHVPPVLNRDPVRGAFAELDGADVVTDRGELPHERGESAGGTRVATLGGRAFLIYTAGVPLPEQPRYTMVVREDLSVAMRSDQFFPSFAGRADGVGALVLSSNSGFPRLSRLTDDGTSFMSTGTCNLADSASVVDVPDADHAVLRLQGGRIGVVRLP